MIVFSFSILQMHDITFKRNVIIFSFYIVGLPFVFIEGYKVNASNMSTSFA